MVRSQPQPKQGLLDALNGIEALYQAVSNANLAVQQAHVALKAGLPAGHQLMTGLKEEVVSLFGVGSPVLEKFGIKPRTAPRQLTSEEAALRAEKVRATRALRHTAGSQQKRSVRFVGTPSLQLGPAPVVSGNATGPAK